VRKRNVILAAGSCLAALTLIAPTAALADPVGTKILAGVGSVTTEKVMNGMAGVIPTLGSYEGSVPPSSVTLPATKAAIAGSDCTGITRPTGSTAGVNELIAQRNAAAATTPPRRPCLDWARSSDSPTITGTGLTWVPFAVDGVTIVTRNDSPLTTNFRNDTLAPNPANDNFLAKLYSCTLDPATAAQYRPLIPQAGSGTRSFFLRKIFEGITPPLALNLRQAEGGTCDNTYGPSALDTTGAAPVPLVESRGIALNDPRNVVPYSIADYKAQSSGAVTDISGNTKMRRVTANGATSTTGIVPDLDNRSFPYLRAVFNVIPSSNATQPDATGTAVGTDPNYGSVFVGNNSTICTNAAIIQVNGFGVLNKPDTLLPAGNTGCGDAVSVKGGPTVVTGAPTT
jgi:hypothetical protein